MNILVTDAHEPAALGTIRSLGRAGHRVIAASARWHGRPAASWSRYCAALRLSPDPWHSHLDFRKWLDYQVSGVEFDAILPVSEAAIFALGILRPVAPPDLHLLVPNDSALTFALSPVFATRKAQELGLSIPPTVFVEPGMALETLAERLDGLRYPVLIRSDHVLTASGAYRQGRRVTAATPMEALRILGEPERTPARSLVQEAVEGRGGGVCLLRYGGEFHLQFAYRECIEPAGPPGAPASRASDHDEALLAAGRRLLDALDYQGVARVEFRRDRRDGTLHFLALHCGLGAALSLALRCGVDFPRAWLECLCDGRPAAVGGAIPAGLRCDGFQSCFSWRDPAPALARGLHLGWARIVKTGDTLMKPIHDLLARERETRIRVRHAAFWAQPRGAMPARILFLCYGNICRSPFASAYWNALRERPGYGALPVAESAGYFPAEKRPTPAWIQDLALAHGVSLAAHRSHGLTRADIDAAGLIFVMDHQNERALLDKFPEAREKVLYLGPFVPGGLVEIEDPFIAGEEATQGCYRGIVAALEGLAAALLGRRDLSREEHQAEL